MKNSAPGAVHGDGVEDDRTVRAEVVPLGRVDTVACAIVAAHMSALMDLPAAVMSASAEAEAAIAAGSRRSDAGQLAAQLGRDRPRSCVRIGVTEVDLCLPVFSHVLGQAQLGGGVAVVSLCRLGTTPDGTIAARERVYERLAKVACHETGHALGLVHCRIAGCLMNFVGQAEGLDGLQLGFCRSCKSELAVRRGSFEARDECE